MKIVKATALGFYKGSRVRPGTVFSVPDNMAGSWFELVERRGAEPEPEPAAEPAAEPTPRRIKRLDL
jgi:hypothetical protein